MSDSSSASYDINNPDDSLSQSSHSSFMTQSEKGSNSDHDENLFGFNKKAFRIVKQSKTLTLIADMLNMSLYNIRSRCRVYTIESEYLRIVKLDALQSKTHESSDFDEIEVMVYKDFREKMLFEIFGEQKMFYFNDKIVKLEELLKKNGAILEGK